MGISVQSVTNDFLNCLKSSRLTGPWRNFKFENDDSSGFINQELLEFSDKFTSKNICNLIYLEMLYLLIYL